jgi:predicted RNA-binding Zn-ribbon protein involved in translation (DUF1610 family)
MTKKLTTEEFIQKAVALHGDNYDYTNAKYKHSHKKVEIICKKHGSFEQISKDHLKGHGCPECGKEKISEARKTHGKSNSKEYKIWKDTKKRCYNKNNKDYYRYGGRGITVCDRWLNSFENFLADMGECPKGYSIDRINNNGDYCPENCRWSTSKEQANNRSNNISLTICNKTMSLKDWCQDTGQNYMTVYTRLNRGWTPEQAIFGKRKRKKINVN